MRGQARASVHESGPPRPSRRVFTYIDLFAGIGGFHQAGDALGGRCVFASEIDAEARRAYAANYGLEPRGDVTVIDAEEIPDHDVLFAGFPCQPFSIIGNRLGFDDARGTLFFEIARILRAKRPRFFILENVKQLSGHDKGRTLEVIVAVLEEIGYKTRWAVLNALDFGLAQKRERTVIVGFLDHGVDFSFPRPVGPGSLEDVLEPEGSVDGRFFASPRIVGKRLEKHRSEHFPAIWHENKSGHVASYPFSCALRAGASYNYLLVNGERRLTPREMLRLQGFPDAFKIVCSDSQTRKQAGNAVPVNVIKAVLEAALHAEGKIVGQSGQSGRQSGQSGQSGRESERQSVQ
ncbi:MAG: DNA (cytosine-5-)-methyltransferase [Clostridiales Family XIII bacterium]|jgi:DNA (cytosine-5)-methyltransferase 1|nr:DNA (cytosine-5-)-methyltransferase [Clostridiales Family XIII bacterium]